MHVSLSCLEMKAKSPSLGVRWNGPIYTKLWAKKSWQVQAAMSTCSTFWDYVGANWMGKCTSSSLRKGHRIKCQCSTGKDNPWALSTQFNLNPGQTVKSRDTVCSRSRVYDQNICRFSFFSSSKVSETCLNTGSCPELIPTLVLTVTAQTWWSNLKQERVALADSLRRTVSHIEEGTETEVWGYLLLSQGFMKQSEYWFSASFLLSLFYPFWASSPLENATHIQGVSFFLC